MSILSKDPNECNNFIESDKNITDQTDLNGFSFIIVDLN